MRDYDDYDYDPDELIENKGDHKYLRRIPWPGRKKKYRYVYDPRIAAQLPVKPAPGEKVRVPHGAQAGHYEILAVKQYGNQAIVDMQHDETGHRMYVKVDDLHKLMQDALSAQRPPLPLMTPPPAPRRGRPAKPETEKLREAHRRADALPRERWKVLDIILDDNNIDDYDLSKRDEQYLRWQRGEGKKPAPLPAKVGLLDAFHASGERKTRFCCLREAFNHAIAKAKTWRDIEPALEMLRTVPGFQEVHLPADVLERHAIEAVEFRDLDEAMRRATEPPPLPDYTRYGVAYDPRREEADVFLDLVTRFGTRQPGDDDDRGGGFAPPSILDDDDLPF